MKIFGLNCSGLRFLFFTILLSFPLRSTVIAIEGNSGAGKSTLSALLAKEMSGVSVPEPVDRWGDIGGHGNILNEFFSDRAAWSLYFTLWATITKIDVANEALLDHRSSPYFFLDRSVLSDGKAFAKVHMKEGVLTKKEKETYNLFRSRFMENYYDQPRIDAFIEEYASKETDPLKKAILRQSKRLMENNVSYPLHGIIYLHTDPNTCKKRADERERALGNEPQEGGIDFLKKLHGAHEEWLGGKEEVTVFGINIPVLTIDGNQDFIKDDSARRALITKVRAFVQKRFAH